MVFLKFILYIVNILFFGYLIVKFVIYPANRSFQVSFSERAVLSFGLGSGFIGLEALLLSFSGPIHLLKLLSYQAWAVVMLYAFFKIKNRHCGNLAGLSAHNPHLNCHGRKNSFSFVFLFFFLLCAWETFYIFSEAACLPFLAWDAWGNWGLKAKIIYFEKSFPFKIWTQLPWMRHPDHLEYPLLIPFLEAYLYFFIGKIYEPLAKLFCSFYYVGLIMLFFNQLKRDFSDKFTWAACFCLATVPTIVSVAYSGYMDVVLTFFMTAGGLYIWRYVREGEDVYLLAGSLFTGLSMWVKNEGLSFWAALFLASIVICFFKGVKIDRKKFLPAIFFIPLVIYLPWVIFKHRLGIEIGCLDNSLGNFAPSIAQRLVIMFHAYRASYFNVGQWNIFWFVFVVYLAWFLISPKDKRLFFFVFIIFFQLIFYAIVFIVWPVSNQTIELYIFSAMERLPLHMLPLALFFVCQQAGRSFLLERPNNVYE